MNLSFPQLLAVTIGGVLIFAAVKNMSPVDVVKTAINNNTVKDGAKPVAVSAQGGTASSTTAERNNSYSGTPIPPAAQYGK